MKKYCVFLGCCFLCCPLSANDCLGYKNIPRIVINVPAWTKRVVQPKEPMDLWHGNVVATLQESYDIATEIRQVKGGFCIGLKSVNITIGFSDFVINIDIRHQPDSCQYNAVLAHEEEHLNTYLSVMDDFMVDLHKSVFAAADSVMPVFVESKDDFDDAIDKMNKELQNHPDLVLVKQKIKAAEEIRNKQIDQEEDYQELNKCNGIQS